MGERGWKTRNGDTASYDDISVFVVPLCRHESILEYIKEEKRVSALARDDSFVKKYVKRDEIQIHTAKSMHVELNSNKETTEPMVDDVGAGIEQEIANSEKIDLGNVSSEKEMN